ncbi:MAG: hypothetical protein Kow00107_01890 [Planctomycetota bacterium]
MKRALVGIILGLVLSGGLSWYARASLMEKLSTPVNETYAISVPVVQGDPVVNYNLTFPVSYLDGGRKLNFGVLDPRNFLVLRKASADSGASPKAEALELGRVVGGKFFSLRKIGGFAEPKNIRIAVRGVNLGIALDDKVATGFLANENLPPRWCFDDGAPLNVSFQPLSSILFADTFMRTESDAEVSEWTSISGEWDIVSKVNPSRSANPFRLGGNAFKLQPALYLLDLPDWDNYRAEISVRPTKNGSCGIAFDYRNSDTFNLVSLHTTNSGLAGKVELASFHNGEKEVIASKEGVISAGQWYHLEFRQTFGRVSVVLGESEVINVADPRFLSGKIALYCGPESASEFDDLNVRSLNSAELASMTASLSSWHAVGDIETENGSAYFTDDSLAMLFMPLEIQEGSEVFGEVSWPIGAKCALFTSGVNSLETALSIPSASIVSPTKLIASDKTASSAGLASFAIKVRDSFALIEVSGDSFYRGSVPLSAGFLKFGVGATAGCKLMNIRIDSSSKGKIALWRNEIFSYEDTMRNWNDDSLHWRRSAERLDVGAAWVNERVFSKRLEATFEITETQLSIPKWVAGVLFPVQTDSALGGAVFKITKDGENYKAVLNVLGNVAWEEELDSSEHPASIGLYRNESFLITYINKRVFKVYAHPEELPQTFVGYTCAGFIPSSSQISVSSDATYEYLFSSAPTEWRSSAGVWEVLNRWQCDPRWSWFSGDSERNDKGIVTDRLAMLWWRRKLEGDFTFEMFFGIKMDNARGEKYNYARDINIGLVSDTSDMDSGYNFILGGQIGNRINAGSWITRKGELMPYTLGGRPEVSRFNLYTSEQHRFWFHYILTRRGNTFRLELTDQKGSHKVFETEDNDPIPADRLCIWTYNCGIMLARVRIQTSGYAPIVDLLQEKEERPKVFYEKKLM